MTELSISEAQDLGLILEINRLLLHPRGLALMVVEEDGESKLVIFDARKEPDGMIFQRLDALADYKKHKNFESLLAKRAVARIKTLGYIIQPLGDILNENNS